MIECPIWTKKWTFFFLLPLFFIAFSNLALLFIELSATVRICSLTYFTCRLYYCYFVVYCICTVLQHTNAKHVQLLSLEARDMVLFFWLNLTHAACRMGLPYGPWEKYHTSMAHTNFERVFDNSEVWSPVLVWQKLRTVPTTTPPCCHILYLL